MGFFSRFLAPGDETAPAEGFQILTFAPAILRLAITGKDAPRELDALAGAVGKLGFPLGFSTDRVFAAAAEMARLIKIEGIAGVTDRMKAELAPDLKADAMRLALVSVLQSPQRDSGEIALLGELAVQIGMSAAEFDALYAATKAFG